MSFRCRLLAASTLCPPHTLSPTHTELNTQTTVPPNPAPLSSYTLRLLPLGSTDCPAECTLRRETNAATYCPERPCPLMPHAVTTKSCQIASDPPAAFPLPSLLPSFRRAAATALRGHGHGLAQPLCANGCAARHSGVCCALAFAVRAQQSPLADRRRSLSDNPAHRRPQRIMPPPKCAGWPPQNAVRVRRWRRSGRLPPQSSPHHAAAKVQVAAGKVGAVAVAAARRCGHESVVGIARRHAARDRRRLWPAGTGKLVRHLRRVHLPLLQERPLRQLPIHGHLHAQAAACTHAATPLIISLYLPCRLPRCGLCKSIVPASAESHAQACSQPMSSQSDAVSPYLHAAGATMHTAAAQLTSGGLKAHVGGGGGAGEEVHAGVLMHRVRRWQRLQVLLVEGRPAQQLLLLHRALRRHHVLHLHTAAVKPSFDPRQRQTPSAQTPLLFYNRVWVNTPWSSQAILDDRQRM